MSEQEQEQYGIQFDIHDGEYSYLLDFRIDLTEEEYGKLVWIAHESKMEVEELVYLTLKREHNL